MRKGIKDYPFSNLEGHKLGRNTEKNKKQKGTERTLWSKKEEGTLNLRKKTGDRETRKKRRRALETGDVLDNKAQKSLTRDCDS